MKLNMYQTNLAVAVFLLSFVFVIVLTFATALVLPLLETIGIIGLFLLIFGDRAVKSG